MLIFPELKTQGFYASSYKSMKIKEPCDVVVEIDEGLEEKVALNVNFPTAVNRSTVGGEMIFYCGKFFTGKSSTLKT